MGVKQESYSRAETIVNKSSMDSKKYIVVKNHVREIVQIPQSSNSEENKIIEDCGKGSRKRKHSSKHSLPESYVSAGEEVNDISDSDLEELKAVYKKCKSVLLKLESKYGHLLNVEYNKCSSSNKILCNNNESKCTCSLSKKIVFNEEGQSTQLSRNTFEHHICLNRLKDDNHKQDQIEDERAYITLPDTIYELEEILTNTSIPITLRNKIIAKIKNLKQEHLNTIRFDKHLLIQQLKLDPGEVLDFKGTNISSLAGYPT